MAKIRDLLIFLRRMSAKG